MGKGEFRRGMAWVCNAGRFLEIAKLQEIAPKAVKAFGEKRFMRSTPWFAQQISKPPAAPVDTAKCAIKSGKICR